MNTLNMAYTETYVKPLSEENFQRFLKGGLNQDEEIFFVNAIHERVEYIFSKLKSITGSKISSFNYINILDSDDEQGYFCPTEFKKEIVLSGEFEDKYSKPFGNSFPLKFLFVDFEKFAVDIYAHFLVEKTAIFDETCSIPTNIIPKEYSYPDRIACF